MKNMRKLVGMMVLCATAIFALSTTVLAQADPGNWWAGFVGWGLGALITGIIVGIVVYMIWGDSEYGNVAKAIALVAIVVGAAAWLGVGITAEPGAGIPTVVQPEFKTTANAANNTTHCTVGVNSYSWSVLWDISDVAISTGDQTTLNFTVRRNDQLGGYYYTNAYVDIANAPTFSTATVDDIALISKTSNRWDITWTDSGSNAFIDIEIASMPQAESKIETVTCAITLNDNAIAGMVYESVSVATFNLIFAETTTDSNGAIIAYSNPTTIPVTLIVTTQA